MCYKDKDNQNSPYFVVDARSMGHDAILLTNSEEHTCYLFKTIHMKLLVEAYDDYFAVQKELSRLFNTKQLNGYFRGLQSLETLMLLISPQFTDGTEQSRKRLRHIFEDRALSIDEIAQKLMKLPADMGFI